MCSFTTETWEVSGIPSQPSILGWHALRPEPTQQYSPRATLGSPLLSPNLWNQASSSFSLSHMYTSAHHMPSNTTECNTFPCLYHLARHSDGSERQDTRLGPMFTVYISDEQLYIKTHKFFNAYRKAIHSILKNEPKI